MFSSEQYFCSLAYVSPDAQIQTDDGHDVARTGFVDFLALVGMHPQDPAEPVFWLVTLVVVVSPFLAVPW